MALDTWSLESSRVWVIRSHRVSLKSVSTPELHWLEWGFLKSLRGYSIDHHCQFSCISICENEGTKEAFYLILHGRKEMFYLTMHSTHFQLWLYDVGHMVKDHSDSERGTCCHHCMGYSFRLAARVLLYASSHRQDSTPHSFCYTNWGTLAGMRNSLALISRTVLVEQVFVFVFCLLSAKSIVISKPQWHLIMTMYPTTV